ncbi:M23 family metallopeptidase [Streptomyces sp. NPDC056161]|uniref:M23 family metallopeptidase n=1 Tax=Streptomyces sp. NPDC056161 TaxID=3345732 RepID=UPI0035E1A03C
MVVPVAVLGGPAPPARAESARSGGPTPLAPTRAESPRPGVPAPPSQTRADSSRPRVPASPPPAVPAIARAWPVGTRPAVVRGWEPPATPYGSGHRGVDLVAAPDAPVRAVAAGRISFAGRVAGRGVVSVELLGTDLRTTYQPVRPSVRTGDEVAAGEVVGRGEPTATHCAAGPCLHWGLLSGGTYLNPLLLLPPWLLHRGQQPRLLPVLGVPLP